MQCVLDKTAHDDDGTLAQIAEWNRMACLDSLFFEVLDSHLHLLLLICHVIQPLFLLLHPLLHLVKNFFQLFLASC